MDHRPDKQLERRRNGRRLLLSSLLLSVILVASYATLVEPFWIEITHHNVSAPVSAPLKIALLSDLHVRGVGRLERNVLRVLEGERPDVIVVTGDFVVDRSGDSSWHAADMRATDELAHLRALTFLRQLHAPLGVYVVRGNWEIQRPLPDDRATYEKAGVALLTNEHVRLPGNVYLAGLDDPSYGAPDPQRAFTGIPRNAFTIAFYHSPEYFQRVAGEYDLALAGHTHGGQIRIPFMRPFWLPDGSGPFLAGWYERRGARLYVSRGVGTSLLRLRFLCRPEIPVFTLVPAHHVPPSISFHSSGIDIAAGSANDSQIGRSSRRTRATQRGIGNDPRRPRG